MNQQQNPCTNYDACIAGKRNNLRYPTDSQSLYANRIYDNQTANRRCYEGGNPIEIIEGFNCNFTWDQLLKGVVIILLIIAFVALAKDFLMPKEIVKVGVPPVEPLTATQLTVEPTTVAK